MSEKHIDVISDLGNDLAVAFLVEKSQKIESKEVPALMARIRAALQPFSSEIKETDPLIPEPNSLNASH